MGWAFMRLDRMRVTREMTAGILWVHLSSALVAPHKGVNFVVWSQRLLDARQAP